MIWVLVIAAAVTAWVAWVFNRLVGLRNRAAAAWSDIDVQLKRRHDLVGNLVETVKGYAAHERETLDQVVRARALAEEARDAGRAGAAGHAESGLSGQISALFALVEAYPDLKASERFLDLHRALIDVEDHIQNARRYYNAVVRDLNTLIQIFPHVLVARAFGIREREHFELESPAEAAVPRFDLEPSS